ncbi:hypothetical protein [Agromyces sp. NPDC058126]|uniref:hypothetical protein n=1 Tax=Agromyces sp. NPDC058126 TaxID=3346350 RepID=UPI0036DD76CC
MRAQPDLQELWRRVAYQAFGYGSHAGELIAEAKRRSIPPRVLLDRYKRSYKFERLSFRWRVRFDALAPGVLNPEVFGQGTWWVDTFGAAHSIRSRRFSTAHLVHAIMFLRERSELSAEPILDAEGSVLDLATSTLMAALEHELERRLDIPASH